MDGEHAEDRVVNRGIIQKHRVFALISLACPVAAFLGTLVYQEFANADFGISPREDDAEHIASALFAFTEVIELVFVTLCGCIVGIGFAILSLRYKRGILSPGSIGLAFNILPFLFLLVLLLSRN